MCSPAKIVSAMHAERVANQVSHAERGANQVSLFSDDGVIFIFVT